MRGDRLRSDLFSDTLNYFVVKDPKCARFYLLQNIHKHLHDVLGRPVISNCRFYTESITSFLNYHFQPLAQRFNSYINCTNHFLNKIKNIEKLPERAILSTMDVFGLYSNMEEVMPLSIRFWKLGITNGSRMILYQNLSK